MPYKCPVPDCEDSEKEFTRPTALKSHIRNKHPDYKGEDGLAREVPIVEEDFATLLTKFKLRGDQAVNIAENISHTGGPRAFEDPEILIKRLSLWSTEITPGRRNLIVEQWFAERGVDIPPEIQRRAGMTIDQIRDDERATKDRDPDVRYIYDTDVGVVRMAKEGERGGTLAQAKELKRMADEENNGGKESPFIMDADGRWTLNTRAKIGGVEYLAFQSMQQAQERGERVDPIEALTRAAEQMRILKESFGGGGSSNLPAWMTDPLAFTEAIRNITSGGRDEGSEVKAAMVEMQKTISEMKEDRWRIQFEAQQKQIQDMSSALHKALEAMEDIKKAPVGRTEMDILHDVVELAKTEVPGLRRDVKDALTSMAPPPRRSTEQREDRKKQFKQAIETDREIEDLGRRVFYAES